jgi:selenocysteine lyase/cysteine desulfurase
MIHLNTAGAGLMPAPVAEAMHECLRREAAGGAYETEEHYDELLNVGVYGQLAELLNAPPADIALFDSATRAWCSVVDVLELGPTDRVWVTPYEYAGNLISLFAMRERTGCRLEVVPATPSGDLDLDWMAANIADDVALVSVTHIPSGCGIVNPVAEIGRLLAPYRCFYAVDGCQSVGQVPTDVAEIGCQLFTGAGRKFLCGPRGTGFAYVAPELRAALRPGFRDLHVAHVVSPDRFEVTDSSARVLELAERTTAAVVGLSAALANPGGYPDPEVYRALRAVVAGLPGVEEIAPGTVHSGIVSFRHGSLPAERICAALRDQGVNTWPIHGDHTPIHMRERGVGRAVRASVHHYTTADEVAEFGRVLDKIVRSELS